MKSVRATSMRQLAVAAGVSHVTVSRALRNDPSISPATTRRIRALAESLGYRPNPLVSALMSNLRSTQGRVYRPTIALLNCWWPPEEWSRSTNYGQVVSGATKRAADLGYHLETFWLHAPAMTALRLAEVFRARRIHGVFVSPIQDPAQPLDFPWGDFAMSTIGYSLREPDLNRACHAHFRAMFRTMEELFARGYRRVGYVTSDDLEARVGLMWGAALRLQSDRMKPRDRVAPLYLRGSDGRAQLRRWVKAQRLDAVVTPLPSIYPWLREDGLAAPARLGFAHLDLSPQLIADGVCGIDQMAQIVGAAAVDLIVSQLNTNGRGLPPHPVTQLTEGRWMEGLTLRPRPDSALVPP